MKKLFLFAMAAVALASCSESDELALSQAQQEAGRGEVAFSVYANRTTRAGKEGVMDMTNLQGEKAGFGIFGYHTNNSLYDPQNSEPNFMYNQRVTWNTGENKWTYDPVKYWPNEFGENAVSNDIDYVSFFAYAPYVEFDPISGVALMPEMPETDEPLTPEQESQLKNQIQWKNITGASRNGDKGDPFIRYMVDVNPSTSVDLMWGVAADNSFQGLANPAVTSKEGECFINLSKQIGVNQTINWRFHHALAKLDVQIIAASDVATEGTTEYEPVDAIPVDEFTRVYLRWIEFSGFAMSGALSLNSKAPQAHWLNYDGATELKSTTIRFNDGLLNGKEGILDNVNPNEVVLGALNDTIIEKPTPLDEDGWMSVEKNAGIPTDKYVNVFAGATADKKSFFVIPTNAPLTINMLYDIETMDTQLNKYLSDGVTPGTRISNEITKELRDVKIEAGKAYNIKIVVGLESVKVTAEVEPWDVETPEQKVDLPYNPGEGGSGGEGGDPLAVPLTMQALTDGTIVVNIMSVGGSRRDDYSGSRKRLPAGGGSSNISRKYSVNGGDKITINKETTTIEVHAGDKVQFYGNGPDMSNFNVPNIAGGTAQVKVYGNIMSMLDEDNYATLTTLPFIAFYVLFGGNENLTDASGLLLPATTLAEACYYGMFYKCTNLTTAPVLPATELAEGCYGAMFYGCTSLNNITCLATAGINQNGSTSDWVHGVPSTGTFTKASGATWPTGSDGIPSGWTVNEQ